MENITPFGDTTKSFPEVFNVIPPQPNQVKYGQLTQGQVEAFFKDGYIIIEDYFDHSLLDDAKESINDMVDATAQLLHRTGKLTDTYEEFGFYERLTKLEKDIPSVSSNLLGLGYLSDAFKKIWSSEKILNAMEQLLGTSDIQGNPVWNLRTKTPQTEAFVVPWHQDVGYMDNDSHSVLQVAAWIPLIDATEKNGCMEVLKGGHKTGKVLNHYGCWRSTHYVEIIEEEMEQTLGINVAENKVICEVPYGGMLLLSNILPHRSLPNLSNDIRWSLDLRWQKTAEPVGFHGLKEGVQLRSSKNPKMEVDWKKFDGDLTLEQALKAYTKNGVNWDPLFPGPFMAKWKVTNRNKHVIAFEESIAKHGNIKGLRWHSYEDI